MHLALVLERVINCHIVSTVYSLMQQQRRSQQRVTKADVMGWIMLMRVHSLDCVIDRTLWCVAVKGSQVRIKAVCTNISRVTSCRWGPLGGGGGVGGGLWG